MGEEFSVYRCFKNDGGDLRISHDRIESNSVRSERVVVAVYEFIFDWTAGNWLR
jgi:hypothetical protein